MVLCKVIRVVRIKEKDADIWASPSLSATIGYSWSPSAAVAASVVRHDRISDTWTASPLLTFLEAAGFHDTSVTLHMSSVLSSQCWPSKAPIFCFMSQIANNNLENLLDLLQHKPHVDEDILRKSSVRPSAPWALIALLFFFIFAGFFIVFSCPLHTVTLSRSALWHTYATLRVLVNRILISIKAKERPVAAEGLFKYQYACSGLMLLH